MVIQNCLAFLDIPKKMFLWTGLVRSDDNGVSDGDNSENGDENGVGGVYSGNDDNLGGENW